MTFLLASPFSSDNSIYTYAAYAISQGVIPYREIQLAHPPFMYLFYAMLIRLVGPDIVYVRLLAVSINLTTIPLTYFMVKILLKNRRESSNLGLLCAGVYAFYPMLVADFFQLESILSLFALLSVIVYLRFHGSKKKPLLFLAGILMGSALMIKLSTFFFIGAILLFHLMHALWHKKYKSIFIDVLIILVGIITPVTFTLMWITFRWHALQQFYLQVYYWQIIRYPMDFSARLQMVSFYFSVFLPLIVTGVLGTLYFVRMAKKEPDTLLLLPAWICGSNSFIYIFVTKYTFFHYFFYLTPYLVLLSVLGFYQIKSWLFSKGKNQITSKPYVTILLAVSTLILLVAWLSISSRFLPSPIRFFDENSYTKMEFNVGNYVAAISNSSDKIWTSEAAIAFFAHRMIVAPNSSDWPLQGFFSDVFGYDWNEYRGDEMKDYKQGVVRINQFVEAWEEEKVKLVIFIRGVGWIPYPDQLLWDGFQGQEGVASYVQEKYELARVITSSEVEPYTFEIWVRK